MPELEDAGFICENVVRRVVADLLFQGLLVSDNH